VDTDSVSVANRQWVVDTGQWAVDINRAANSGQIPEISDFIFEKYG
jgi:hypothetical protein